MGLLTSDEPPGPPRRTSSEPKMFRTAALVSSVACLLIAVVVIIAWCANALILASVFSDYVPMTLGAATMVLLLSLSVLVRGRFGSPIASTTIQIVVASITIFMASFVLLEPVLHTGIDFETWLYSGKDTSSGYLIADTSPLSSATLVVAGVAVLLSLADCVKHRTIRTIASMLSIFVFLVGLVTVLGYAYGSPLLYGGDVRPASLLSGVSLLLIGVAQVSSQGPDRWPIVKFVGPSVEARLLRVFVPLVASLVLASGSLSSRALSASANPALVSSLAAILTAILVGVAVARFAARIGRQIDRADALRRKAEDELRLANEKLTVLGSMTRHDALNQLSVVFGRLELLKMDSTDPSVLKHVDESLESVVTIRRILEFTGQYQKLGVNGPSWIDVSKAFGAAVRGLDPKQVRVISDVGGLTVLADVMFENVLVNFVDNSVRHGDHVTTIRLHCREEPKGLLLVYEDDGVGLSGQEKANLFKRGFGRHTGFGMYLSKEILEFSGLAIRETGTPGTGARFEISVPKDKYRLSRTNI